MVQQIALLNSILAEMTLETSEVPVSEWILREISAFGVNSYEKF